MPLLKRTADKLGALILTSLLEDLVDLVSLQIGPVAWPGTGLRRRRRRLEPEGHELAVPALALALALRDRRGMGARGSRFESWPSPGLPCDFLAPSHPVPWPL